MPHDRGVVGSNPPPPGARLFSSSISLSISGVALIRSHTERGATLLIFLEKCMLSLRQSNLYRIEQKIHFCSSSRSDGSD